MFNLRGYDRVKAIHLLNKSINEKGDKNGHKAMILKNIKVIQNIKTPNFFGIKKLNYIKNIQTFSEEKKNHVKNRIEKKIEFDDLNNFNNNNNNKKYFITRNFNKINNNNFKTNFFDSYLKNTYGNLIYNNYNNNNNIFYNSNNNSVYQNYKNMTKINNNRKKIEIKKNKILSNQISIGINTDNNNDYNFNDNFNFNDYNNYDYNFNDNFNDNNLIYNNENIIFPKINHNRNQSQFKSAKISFINKEENKINNNNKNKTIYINSKNKFLPFQNLLISEKINKKINK
jgi:hypothetical protein